MTLYRLTGEGGGKFICDSALCEKHWPPLSASATSSAISGLGKVKRPDGMEQLTYRGGPLYTFTGDTAPGQVNGQGTVEGGRWIAVKISVSTY
jgi:predicted lipoprotein with Yx(FWY)xxD motif